MGFSEIRTFCLGFELRKRKCPIPLRTADKGNDQVLAQWGQDAWSLLASPVQPTLSSKTARALAFVHSIHPLPGLLNRPVANRFASVTWQLGLSRNHFLGAVCCAYARHRISVRALLTRLKNNFGSVRNVLGKGASFNFNIYQLVGRYFKALSDRSDADGNIFFILFLAK